MEDSGQTFAINFVSLSKKCITNTSILSWFPKEQNFTPKCSIKIPTCELKFYSYWHTIVLVLLGQMHFAQLNFASAVWNVLWQACPTKIILNPSIWRSAILINCFHNRRLHVMFRNQDAGIQSKNTVCKHDTRESVINCCNTLWNIKK